MNNSRFSQHRNNISLNADSGNHIFKIIKINPLNTGLSHALHPLPEVPVLKADGYSGKLTIRIAPIEHSKAAYYAKEEGVSLNKFISDAIVSRNSELSLAQ